jgi:hypothetical protein
MWESFFSLFQSPMSDDPPGGRVALKPPSRMIATVISDGLFLFEARSEKTETFQLFI